MTVLPLPVVSVRTASDEPMSDVRDGAELCSDADESAPQGGDLSTIPRTQSVARIALDLSIGVGCESASKIADVALQIAYNEQ